MSEYFSKEQILAARRTNLYDYLMRHHSSEFQEDSPPATSIRPINDHSISIKRGYSGYKDFAKDDT